MHIPWARISYFSQYSEFAVKLLKLFISTGLLFVCMYHVIEPRAFVRYASTICKHNKRKIEHGGNIGNR